jgi:hypothetical protein
MTNWSLCLILSATFAETPRSLDSLREEIQSPVASGTEKAVPCIASMYRIHIEKYADSLPFKTVSYSFPHDLSSLVKSSEKSMTSGVSYNAPQCGFFTFAEFGW